MTRIFLIHFHFLNDNRFFIFYFLFVDYTTNLKTLQQKTLLFQKINEYQKISKIERDGIEGIFKGNAVYINGLFPNRVVNCSDSGYFGSRWEPCGITPLECYASGTPVISIKTIIL